MESSGEYHPPIALDEGVELREQYCITGVLGAGSFGITYLARDRHLDTPVAIKEYFPRQSASRGDDGISVNHYSSEGGDDFEYGLGRFRREGRTLAQFSHPNIVRVRSYFEANGTGYLVMDYYEGQTLDSYLNGRGGTLPEAQAVDMMTDVLDGLSAVHEEGVLHRDIDPQNIYRTEGGDVILIDFGAAREAMGERSQSLTTILKPGYAPYEQYHEDGDQGPWTDVYACAATLYRCLTGYTPPEAVSRLREDELKPPRKLEPSVSIEVSIAVMKGMAVRPERRPATPEAFAQLLQQDTVRVGDEQTEAFDSTKTRSARAEAETVIGAETDIGRGATVTPEEYLGWFAQWVSPQTGIQILGAFSALSILLILSISLLAAIGMLTIGRTYPYEDPGQKVGTGEVSVWESESVVRVPGGKFVMGATNEGASDRQQAGRKTVTVSPFFIDRFEVTNEEYRAFLADRSAKQAAQRRPDSTVWAAADLPVDWETHFRGAAWANHPVVAVTWREAKAYCEWKGRRLPTEAEWEYAARAGRVGSLYPWAGVSTRTEAGEYLANFDPEQRRRAADGHEFTAPVGTYPPSRWGLYDMAGNAAEWVADAYTPTYEPLSGLNPRYRDPEEHRRIVRGGSWAANAVQIGVGIRQVQPQSEASPRIGFRCATDVEAME